MTSKTRTAEELIRIFHVSSRETVRMLRDDILRLHGFEVDSTLSYTEALNAVSSGIYDLVLVDVEGEHRVKQAEELCGRIKEILPDQHLAYVCNYRVAVESECPEQVIRAEFDPEALVRYVRETLAAR